MKYRVVRGEPKSTASPAPRLKSQTRKAITAAKDANGHVEQQQPAAAAAAAAASSSQQLQQQRASEISVGAPMVVLMWAAGRPCACWRSGSSGVNGGRGSREHLLVAHKAQPRAEIECDLADAGEPELREESLRRGILRVGVDAHEANAQRACGALSLLH